ncbi:Na+/H+ antiporter subunit A [Nesterenkonia halophila]|uniref:Na+/H+ antiporter subunit A n=1 Tax=Nesterenkonia halophila TaxID=302044 RepID=UPI001291801F|nr:Na+/H+ antiporter subunit A [Nesterenkonia halophila]
MLTLLAALFAASLVVPWVMRRLGRATFHLLALLLAVALTVLLVRTLPQALDADQAAVAGPRAPPVEVTEWIPSLGVDIALRADVLSLVMTMLILGVGALVMLYCARYFSAADRSAGPFAAELLAFAAAMLGLVLSDDLIMLFVFWELTTVLSFLLIGHASHRIVARRSAIQALVVTTFGGLAMLVGLVLLGELAGTYRLSEILAAAGAGQAAGAAQLSGAGVDVAVLLLLVGAVTKSALVPFHFWLPAAMAAPTPVSAYLHAAAMVKAGVFLVARLAPGFHDTAFWDATVIGLGLATLIIGAWRSLRQTDLKLVLAYGTVSQLGLLVLVNGLGTAEAALAGVAMLLAHGLFKAALFMVVGIIDHETGTRDLRQLSGLGRGQPALLVTAVLAAASMAGIPPLFGFVAKESALESMVAVGGGLGWTVAVGVALGSGLTVAYSARFLWGAFAAKPGVETTPTGRLGVVFLAAPAALALLGLLLGPVPQPVGLLGGPISALSGAGEEATTELALWHGLAPGLGLSAAAWLLGAVLFLLSRRDLDWPGRVPQRLEAERLYRGLIRGLDALAVRLTSQTQRGSLGFYLYIILTVATLVPLSVLLLAGHRVPADWILAETPLQVVLAVVVLAGAVGAVRAHKRFMAVLLVSLCGFGSAGIFALQGSPDLALTILLVESAVLVVFVLALRMLPAGIWTQNPTGFRTARALLGAGFGLVMMAAVAAGLAARSSDPVSVEFPWLAHDVGHGANIVNVTLVDIRAWDTFGEITVLASAATGVASLIFVQRRDVRRRSLHEVPTGSVGRVVDDAELSPQHVQELRVARSFATVAREAWLVAGRTVAPEHRSIVFEVVTRLLFHAVILLSVYLLLAGHNDPGGGFAGGLLVGLALMLRYLAGGRYELEAAVPFSASALMGWGMTVACASGMMPLLVDGQLFQSAYVELTLPLLGEHALVSSMIFDIGVYLVVAGLILDILRSLGAEIDVRSEQQSLAEASRLRRRGRMASAWAGTGD